ncbi:MAG TPA: metallophosphoesterase [Thermomicrobiales bacterium]|nr:metallophosphoesterase [Thermomicrobiales bacterium]HET9659257.1 metallophosphoesterase [Thermomicrobiales bacterium]
MRLRLSLAAVAIALGSLAYYRLRHVNPYRPRLERIEIPLPPGAGGLDGLRIGFVTDTHVGPFTSANDLRRGLALFDDEPLDLLLLGGDYVSESNLYAPAMADAIGSLAARAHHGAFAVMGNHDLPLGVDRVRAELERVGVRVLRNEHAIVEWHGAQLAVVGIDDTVVGQADPNCAFAGIPARVPRLSLWHEADFAEQAAQHGAFAQLSGHTHGGQVRLPLIGAIWLPPDGKRRDMGCFDVEGMTLYVARGLGVYRPPVRLCCPPEVTLVTLRSSPAQPAMR